MSFFPILFAWNYDSCLVYHRVRPKPRQIHRGPCIDQLLTHLGIQHAAILAESGLEATMFSAKAMKGGYKGMTDV